MRFGRTDPPVAKLVGEKLRAGYVDVAKAPASAAPPVQPASFKQALAAIAPALEKSVRPYASIIAKPREACD